MRGNILQIFQDSKISYLSVVFNNLVGSCVNQSMNIILKA